jgi:MFS family permease
MALAAVSTVPYLMIAVCAPGLAESLNYSKADLGRLFSAMAWGGLAGSACGGLCASRCDAAKAFRISLLVTGISFLAAGSCASPRMLAALIPLGVGAASATSVVASTLVPLLAPSHARRVFSMSLAAGALAGILVPLAGAALLSGAGGDGWPSADILSRTFCVCGVAMLAGAMLRIPLTSPAPTEPLASGSNSTEWREIAIAVLLVTLHGTSDSVMYQWAPTFFQESFPVHAFHPGLILSGHCAAYFVGRCLLSALPEGKWERLLLVLPGAASFVLLNASFLCSAYIPAAVLYVCASFCYGLEYPALMGIVARTPRRVGSVVALTAIVGCATTALTTALIGSLAAQSGVRSAMLLLPLGFLGFSAVAFVWSRPAKQMSAIRS